MSVTTYRRAEVRSAGGQFVFSDERLVEPIPGQVQVRVAACGVCHSDAALVNDNLPGLSFPLTPGHEIAGRVEAVGDNTYPWKVGDRVAIGWAGGYCGHCDACREGSFIHCEKGQITGASFRGGYSEIVEVPATALARIPPQMSYADAAPLACAGVTMFHALRSTAARAGDVVAILGLGGLGHLGVQFASKMGFNTVAIARGSEKERLAIELGAHYYIDSLVSDVSAELTSFGGARVIAATAANTAAIEATIDGLSHNGELIIIAVPPEPISVLPTQLIFNSAMLRGHPVGTSKDIEDTLNFAALHRIQPRVEKYPLDRVADGYQRMLDNAARFRVVLTME